MVRPLRLLTVLALAAPPPAMAQAWTAGAALVAAAPPIGSQGRAFTAVDASPQAFNVIDERPPNAKPTQVPTAPPALKVRTAPDAPETPRVAIRAKDEWSDDQGFRASPTRLSYKLRF